MTAMRCHLLLQNQSCKFKASSNASRVLHSLFSVRTVVFPVSLQLCLYETCGSTMCGYILTMIEHVLSLPGSGRFKFSLVDAVLAPLISPGVN